MGPRRRRSLLEDDFEFVEKTDESSGGDVCESCGHARDRHEDGGACVGVNGKDCGGKCEGFVE